MKMEIALTLIFNQETDIDIVMLSLLEIVKSGIVQGTGS